MPFYSTLTFTFRMKNLIFILLLSVSARCEESSDLEAENEVELRRLPGEEAIKSAESVDQHQTINQAFAVSVNHGKDGGSSQIFEAHGHPQQQQQPQHVEQTHEQSPQGPSPDLNIIRPIAYVKLRQVDPQEHAALTEHAKEAAQTYGGPRPAYVGQENVGPVAYGPQHVEIHQQVHQQQQQDARQYQQQQDVQYQQQQDVQYQQQHDVQYQQQQDLQQYGQQQQDIQQYGHQQQDLQQYGHQQQDLQQQFPQQQYSLPPIQGSQIFISRPADYGGFKPIIKQAPLPAPAILPQAAPLQPGYNGNHDPNVQQQQHQQAPVADQDHDQARPIVGKIVLNASPNDLPNAGHILDYASGAPYHGNFNFKPYSNDYTTGVNINKGRVLPNPAPGEEYKGEGVHSNEAQQEKGLDKFNSVQEQAIREYEQHLSTAMSPAHVDLDMAFANPNEYGGYKGPLPIQQQPSQQQVHFQGPVGYSEAPHFSPQPQAPVARHPTFGANIYGPQSPQAPGFGSFPQLAYSAPQPLRANFFGQPSLPNAFHAPQVPVVQAHGFFGNFGQSLRTRFRPFGSSIYNGLSTAGDKLITMGSTLGRPFRFLAAPLRGRFPSFQQTQFQLQQVAPHAPTPYRGIYNSNYGYKAAASSAIPSVLKAPFKSMVKAIKARRAANANIA